jgi:hypothetical protein
MLHSGRYGPGRATATETPPAARATPSQVFIATRRKETMTDHKTGTCEERLVVRRSSS